MSGYLLCRTGRAKKPYYIEAVRMNIYSAEELCYYLFHNSCLVDETLMDEPLFAWLQKELGLELLAKKLQALKAKGAKPHEEILPVFKEISYLSYEEVKQLNGRLEHLANEPAIVRKRRKGDCLVENGIYVDALRTYQEILEELKNGGEPRKGFLGSIYHNLGCVYSYLFQKEEALLCFEKAYGCLHTRTALKSYLCAFFDARTPEEYAGKQQELGVDEQTAKEIKDEMTKTWENSRMPVYSRDVDSYLEQLTAEYHKSTGC